MNAQREAIPPGSTIAILGGGHMGRLTALAAKALGYRVHVLESDASTTSEGVADRSVPGRLNDLRAVAEVARDAHVVTTSIEQIPVLSLEAASTFAPVRPGIEAIGIAQEREHERRWLEERGVRVGAWRAADTRDEVFAAVTEFAAPCYLKPRIRRDGDLGPILVSAPGEVAAAWIALRGRPCVVERVLPVDLELSVLVARAPRGEIRAYPPALSFREHTKLLCSAVPGPVPEQLAQKAEALACYVAAKLEIEGLLAVEMFLLKDGRLVVNELVPCAHATFHATEGACATSQFEQLVRAITGLPLGATDVVRPGASVTVPGELWQNAKAPDFADALGIPGVRLHLYAAREPRVGRVMGHLSASGATPDEAIGTALLAADRLIPGRARRSIARRRKVMRRRRPPAGA